jgi:hypothetical protein
MQKDFEKIRPYLANDAQIAYARLARLEEGSGRGQRIVDVANGSGLNFTVTPDRGMNIVECFFKGIPIAFRTPCSHRAVSGNWLKDWTGGLMTTCGLRNVGSPSGNQGIHGAISSESAEQLGCFSQNGEVKISGVLREGAIFDSNFVLERTIKTAYGSNKIEISDKVTNYGEKTDFTEILYHCNLGYPFISEDIEFEIVKTEITPRNEEAKEGLSDWNKYPAPLENFSEHCFRHEIPADENNFAAIKVINKKLGIALTIKYDVTTLPFAVEWKKPSKNAYVLGLEPTNSSLGGCEFDKANGFGKFLEPNESISYNIIIEFEEI